MKRLILILIIALLFVSCHVFASVNTLSTGSLVSGSGLIGASSWAADMNLSWNVSLLDNVYNYEYILSDTDTGQAKSISHIILQTSDCFDGDNIWDFKINNQSATPLIQYWSEQQGNPSLPASVYGIKIQGGTGTTWTVAFKSNRAPMWGNFYAKDGKTDQIDNTVWNSDFLITPSDRYSFESIGNYVAIPDTKNIVPELPSSLLGAMTILPAALIALKKKR